jgi:hypothetical protein
MLVSTYRTKMLFPGLSGIGDEADRTEAPGAPRIGRHVERDRRAAVSHEGDPDDASNTEERRHVGEDPRTAPTRRRRKYPAAPAAGAVAGHVQPLRNGEHRPCRPTLTWRAEDRRTEDRNACARGPPNLPPVARLPERRRRLPFALMLVSHPRRASRKKRSRLCPEHVAPLWIGTSCTATAGMETAGVEPAPPRCKRGVLPEEPHPRVRTGGVEPPQPEATRLQRGELAHAQRPQEIARVGFEPTVSSS